MLLNTRARPFALAWCVGVFAITRLRATRPACAIYPTRLVLAAQGGIHPSRNLHSSNQCSIVLCCSFTVVVERRNKRNLPPCWSGVQAPGLQCFEHFTHLDFFRRLVGVGGPAWKFYSEVRFPSLSLLSCFGWFCASSFPSSFASTKALDVVSVLFDGLSRLRPCVFLSFHSSCVNNNLLSSFAPLSS